MHVYTRDMTGRDFAHFTMKVGNVARFYTENVKKLCFFRPFIAKLTSFC